MFSVGLYAVFGSGERKICEKGDKSGLKTGAAKSLPPFGKNFSGTFFLFLLTPDIDGDDDDAGSC